MGLELAATAIEGSLLVNQNSVLVKILEINEAVPDIRAAHVSFLLTKL